jgi:hypothetical protein
LFPSVRGLLALQVQRAGVDATIQILGTAVRVRFTPRNG